MTVTAHDIFSGTIQKTDEWLHEIMDELGWEEPHRAYTALRATLHALRDRLTVDEAAQFASQVPMLVRGFFYEGYKPAGKPIKMRTEDEFIEHVESEYRRDIGEDPRKIVRAVFKVLSRRMSEGEIKDVVSMLPGPIRALWP